MWEEFNCLGDAFTACDWHIASVALVVFGGGSEVPGFSPSAFPQFLCVCGLIHKCFVAWGGKWGAVVVKCAVDVVVRRDFGVET